MSKVDKIFEELGYKKILIKRNFGCIYEYEKADKIISFYNNKTFAIYNYIDSFEYCNMQELQAINQKCKELGVDRMSNIEQILSKCDNCKLNECDGCITCSDMQVIKARIKELEDKLQEINGYILTKGIDEPLKTATQIECEYQKQYIIQQEITRLKQYAKELMKEKQQLTTALLDSIPTQKVKDILNEIQEEYNKLEEQFNCIWDKKSKDNYDRYKLQELSAMQQELGFILGKFEKLLEEGE